MGALSEYRYTIEFKYLNIKKGTFNRITGRNIDWVMIDRDYDKYNMPIMYASINVNYKIADDMIRNYRDNLINVSITKHAYDPEDDNWYESTMDEEYIEGQFEYFTDDKVTDTAELQEMDPDEDEIGEKKDLYRKITIGLMKLSLINKNKIRFNMTLYNTDMTNAIMTSTKGLVNLVMEPLSYNDLLPQIIVPSVDSVNKIISALNNVKVLYPSPYRFFMDFDYAYLLSSDGISVPRKGQRITDVLYAVKKITNTSGMKEGMYINRSQKNYQINISNTNVDIYDNQAADKSMTDVVAIPASGDKQEQTVNMDKSTSVDNKYATVNIPNDNLNMIKNITAAAAANAVEVCMIKDNIDASIIDINGVTVIHHLDEDSKYNGQYLLTRKREILLNDSFDFTMTVVANYKKLFDIQGSE